MISEIQRKAFLVSQVRAGDKINLHRGGVILSFDIIRTLPTPVGQVARVHLDNGEECDIYLEIEKWDFTGDSKARVDAVLNDIANNGIETLHRGEGTRQ